MKRIVALIVLSTILLGLAAPTLAGPPQAPSLQGGSVSDSFGHPSNFYLEFTISGADFTLREGTRADYVGQATGGPIQFSGKMVVQRDKGYVSYVTMEAGATGTTEWQSVRWPREGEDGKVTGTTVELPFSFTVTTPPGYTGDSLSGTAHVQVCGGACESYTVSWEAILPTSEPADAAPPPIEEPEPLPPTERSVTIRGTVSALDASASGAGGQVRPLLEAPVLLFRNGEEWTRMLSQPPDGSYEFIVPHTTDLAVGVFLEHGLSAPATFQVVYDQAADPIWVATQPFDVDETTPDVLVKDINLSDPGQLYSGPTQVPPDQLDDVGLIYTYARDAWKMAASLLGLEFSLPTVKIRAFSTNSEVAGTAFWRGPGIGGSAIDPVIEISPKQSDYSKAGGGDTVMHEMGHHIMADAYNDELPGVAGEPNHGGFANATTTDSWVEGFATFYALWTKRDQIQQSSPQLYWNRGDAQNLELNYLAWDGLEEDAVSSLLWDLLDPIEPQDATAMSVVPNPGGVIGHDYTLYGDYVQVDSADLWTYLSNGANSFNDRPPTAPPFEDYPYIFDIKQLYWTLQANGVGLTLDATPNGLDPVDELFIAHGFFADIAPQNQAWDVGEEIGATGNLSLTVGTETYPERLYRRSPPPKESYITYQVVDAAGSGEVGVTDFVVEVRFEPPFEIYNYEVPARAWSEDMLYYSAPPSHYATTTTIRAGGPGVVSSTPLQFTNQEYWALHAKQPVGSLMEYSFEVDFAEGSGSGQGPGGESVPGEVDYGSESSFADSVLLLFCCGGLVLVPVLGIAVVIGVRRRKRRQPSPGREQPPAPVVQPPAPAAPPPPAGGWQLAVVQGPGTGQRYPLGRQARLGRSRDNEISLQDDQSSRRHAQVWQTPDGYAVQDTGSTNGTFVNGVRIQQPTRLAPGDRLQVGDTVFQVVGPAAGQTCAQCGQAVQPGTRFCGSCGAQVG